MARMPMFVIALALAFALPASVQSAQTARAFDGRWDLTLRDADGTDHPSWIEVVPAQGGVRVRMVGRWGHARVLRQASIDGDTLRFTSPREEEGGTREDMVFEGRLGRDGLAGTASGPDGARWTWRGVRAPALARSSAPRWRPFAPIFDGTSLAGWQPLDPSARAWRVVDGALVSPGGGSELRTRERWQDFRLHVEFFCEPGANSGVYLRGRYEVQIEDDAEPEGPDRRTGAVYGFLAPGTPAGKIAGAWHALDVTLVGRTVTIALDGRTLVDRGEIPGITGGALDSDEGAPGPVILQGSEAGHVHFRALRIAAAAGEGEMP